MSHQIKCGHCHGIHPTSREVLFCSQGRAAAHVVAASVTHTPAPPVWPLTFAPRAMVERIKHGRYAVRADQNVPYVFVRCNRPQTGKKKGWIIFQTQHSEKFKNCLIIYPSGNVQLFDKRIDHSLLLVAVDPVTSLRAYARELEVCGQCGKTLTVERSRYYGIGPECEQNWPEVIEQVDEDTGPYYPGII